LDPLPQNRVCLILLRLSGGSGDIERCRNRGWRLSRVACRLRGHGKSGGCGVVAWDVAIVIVDVAGMIAEGNDLLGGEVGGQDVLRERGEVRREATLHSHLTTLFDDLPAHDGHVITHGDDANMWADEREVLVQRCVILCFVFADDRVALCDDAPLCLERVGLPQAS